MGCGSSTPVKDGDGMERAHTSAAGHRDSRTRDSSQRGPSLNVGPDYKKIKHLGKGGTGDTWAFKNTKTGEMVAIKLLKRPLPKVLVQNITREFTIQAELGFGHGNVIKAYEALLTPTHLCLVMEMAEGGSLTAYVADKWQKAQAQGLFLSEDEALYFFKQFLSAVKYCHTHGVAHRDLKLDNTLLDNSNPPIIKICDFGFAKAWSEDANMLTQIGTPVYMSPELINLKPDKDGVKKGYDGRSVDVWASGILLLVMLLGSFPFDHTEHPDPNTSEAHLEVWLQQVSKRWSEVPHMRDAVQALSVECKDLLNRIFVIDAKQRITINQIEKHPWYKRKLPATYEENFRRLKTSQEDLDKHHKMRKQNEAGAKERARLLELMVQEATKLPEPGDQEIKRIDLREDALPTLATLATAATHQHSLATAAAAAVAASNGSTAAGEVTAEKIEEPAAAAVVTSTTA